MPEVSAVAEVTQIGVEVTPGLGVAANKKLQSLSLDISPDGEIDVFTPSGQLVPVIAALGREFATSDVEGQPTYTELIYLAASALRTPTITTPAGTVRLHTFSLNPNGGDPYTTYTIERGSAVRARKVVNGCFRAFGMTFSREEIGVSGELYSEAVQTAITMTASPTAVPLIPILPKEVSVYLDDTWAALGTTKLVRAIEVGFNVSDRRNPVWPLDAALTSFAAQVEGMPGTEVTLRAAADAAGEGIYANMRAGTSKFMRIEAIGPIIEAALTYRMRADICFKVTELPEYDEEEGLRTIEWTGQMFADPTSGNAFEFSLQNTQAAL